MIGNESDVAWFDWKMTDFNHGDWDLITAKKKNNYKMSGVIRLTMS